MYADKNAHIIMTDEITVRSSGEGAFVAFQILPKSDRQGFWINSSPFITVTVKETDKDENLRVLSVNGTNNGKEPVEGSITVTLDDGESAECLVRVLPELLPAPEFRTAPEIIFRDGNAVIEYELKDTGDNIDESDIEWYRVDKKSCRKLAVSRNNRPCKEIALTMSDIGMILRADIKQKHSDTVKGQGLEVFSDIVRSDNVNNKTVYLDVETVPVDNSYSMEKGCFTVRGNLVYTEGFGSDETAGLLTESMGCGIYYSHQTETGQMSLDVRIEPECINGNGFSETHQYEEIYIKYDPESGNGYGLRIKATASDDGNVIFCLYQYKNGNGTAISEEYVSGAFRPGCEINLQAKDNVLNVFITYDDGDSFSDVEIRARIKENGYGGFGFKHMAETEEGYRGCLKFMKATYI